MKSERRHELQHNDLAEWILKTYERILPYRNTILGVGLLVVVLLVGMSFWHSQDVAQAGEAWNSLGYPVGIPVFTPDFAREQTIDVMQQRHSNLSWHARRPVGPGVCGRYCPDGRQQQDSDGEEGRHRIT